MALTTKTKVDCLKAIGKDKVTVMLQHKNFTFNSKQDFIDYIEKKMETYWENHNDSFSAVCEELDSYNGFLGDNRCFSMDELDDLLYGKKPSEVIQMIDTDNFNYSDNFFYYDIYGIRSTDEKEYFNDFNYSDVFEDSMNNYAQVFSPCYGRAYYELFSDIEDINNSDEDEIQSSLNDGDYDYLFVDDDEFFSDDDLD